MKTKSNKKTTIPATKTKQSQRGRGGLFANKKGKASAPATKTKPAKKGQGRVHGSRKGKASTPVTKTKSVKKGHGGIHNNRKGKVTASVVALEPVKKGRGGLRDYSEAKAKTVQRVRGEFLSDTFKPKMTLAYKTVTFNMACVNLFQNCQHVSISIDQSNLRLIVEPTQEYDKNGLKFANFKNGRNVPRTCTIKIFCLMLFDFMNWNPNAKYRILTVFQEFDDKKIMVFNLDEAQQVFSEVTVNEDGRRRRNTTVNMPPNWKERFGYTMDELDEKTRITFSNTLLTIDPKTGERRGGNIEPKRPTAEELMHEPYGGIRTRKKEKKDE